jgi:hypothetical protein
VAERPGSLATPISILIAGALIAAGLYFGLRGRAGSGTAPAPRAAETAASTAPTAPPVAVEGVARQAAQALAEARAGLAASCWAPAARVKANPPLAKWTFDFTFAADGTQLGRGVSEDRATSRPEVTACVLARLPPLRIPAPGASVRVNVPFELP